jgi:hypothetical protein
MVNSQQGLARSDYPNQDQMSLECSIKMRANVVKPAWSDLRRLMPATPHLDDADLAVLVALLKQTIAADPFPLSPRIRTLRTILAKLDPSPPLPQPYPTPKPPGTPSAILAKHRGRRR